jgi:hypothetical protein
VECEGLKGIFYESNLPSLVFITPFNYLTIILELWESRDIKELPIYFYVGIGRKREISQGLEEDLTPKLTI